MAWSGAVGPSATGSVGQLPPECSSFLSGACFRLARLLGGYAFKSDEAPEAIVLGPDERTLHLVAARASAFDTTTGRRLAGVSLVEPATSCAISSDGAQLLVGTRGGRLALYDLARKAALWDVFATSMDAPAVRSVRAVPAIRAVALAPDGATAAAFGETESVVRVFRGGALVGALAGAAPLAFSPDGAMLWAGSTLYDVARGSEVLRATTPDGGERTIAHVAFLPDGRSLAVADADGTVELSCAGRRVWSSPMPAGHGGKLSEPTSLDATADGRELVTTSYGTYQVWDAASGARVREGRFGASHVALGRRGRVLFGTSSTAIRRLDLATGASLDGAGHTAPLTSIACAPRAPTAVTADAKGVVHLWHLEQGVALRTLERYGEIVRVAFFPDGRRVAVLSKSTLRVWDVATNEVALEITKLTDKTSGLRDATDVDVSPDGTRLLVCNEDGWMRLVDVATKSDVWRSQHRARFARFTADGRIVATGSRAVLLLAAVTGDAVRRFDDSERIRPQPFALLRGEGALVHVRTTEGPMVRRLDDGDATPLGECPRALELLAASPHTGVAVFTTADRPDAYQAAANRSLEMFDVERRARLATIDLASSDDVPACAAFTADGGSLLVGTARGVVLVFEVAPPR